MKAILLTILLSCSCTFGFAQKAQPNQDDYTVGLVLSGGGAKGLAHIGTLKVIDSLGIRVDYIGGTSMGAIIGALYASGYSGKQLEEIFNSVDFTELIQDELPRSAKTFYEKEDSERYAITLPFNDFKIAFPQALSKGQNIYNLLAQLLQHVNHIENFNELPIPFLCIATDVEKGEQVVLDKGYLPDVITASGAFPSLFEPIEIDGKLLIDGGVTNNYPIDEIKERKPNIIIGVDVQDGLADREKLKSATGVLFQINNYRTINDMKIKSKQTDLYIQPDIKGFTVISFDEGVKLIERGEAAAKKQQKELQKIADKQQRKIVRQPITITDSLTINALHIDGNEKYTRSYVRGKLRLQTPSTVSFKKLQEGINNLAATGNFSALRYRIRHDGKNSNSLIVDLKESPNTTSLRLAAHYDDLYKSAGLINITKKNVLFNSDVASLDLILGDNIRYNFEYYIDKGIYWSIGLKSRYNHFERGIDFALFNFGETEDTTINRIDVEFSDFTNQFYIQTDLREEFALGIGLEHKRLNITSETITDGEEEETTFEKSDFISTFGRLKLDTYDNKYFPKKGMYFEGDFHWYLYSTDYTKQFDLFSLAKAKIGYATPIYRNISLNLVAQGGFKLGETPLSSLDFVLGGYGNNFINNYIPFLGYDFLSFGGNSFVSGLISVDYEIFKDNHLNFSANYANAANAIFENGEWFTAPTFQGYAIGYGLETFFGPLQLKYSWTPDRKGDQVYISLGFWF